MTSEQRNEQVLKTLLRGPSARKNERMTKIQRLRSDIEDYRNASLLHEESELVALDNVIQLKLKAN